MDDHLGDEMTRQHIDELLGVMPDSIREQVRILLTRQEIVVRQLRTRPEILREEASRVFGLDTLLEYLIRQSGLIPQVPDGPMPDDLALTLGLTDLLHKRHRQLVRELAKYWVDHGVISENLAPPEGGQED